MKRVLKRINNSLGFTGIWMLPVVKGFWVNAYPEASERIVLVTMLLATGWVLINNLFAMKCEGKHFEEFRIGDGVFPDRVDQQTSAEKRAAMRPKVPADLKAKQPEGIILGKTGSAYVRILPSEDIFHYAVIGGSGSGKTSTVLLDSLLANFQTNSKPVFQVFAIDIKGELHQKSVERFAPDVLIVDPADRTSNGWDAYYRLHESPSDDLVVEAMEEIAQALIVSSNSKDDFFVENGRSMFIGLLICYFKQGETFIDTVCKVLEADIKTLLSDIIRDSEPRDLWYKYLAKFAGKGAEAVEDCMMEMTTSLSVFSKADIRYCFRDNQSKASPDAFGQGKSVFLAVPEHLLESYKAVMRLCTVQTFKAMERRSEMETTPVLLLIDEFARLGKLTGIQNALATLRSKKVMLMLAFQSLAQCEVIYGREETRVIVDNCRVKVICECSDANSSKTIQEWCGKYREKRVTVSTGKNRSKSYSFEEKPIVDSKDLLVLAKQEEVILILPSEGYLRVQKAFYFKDKQLRLLADRVKISTAEKRRR